MTTVLHNGIGASLGDSLAMAKPLVTTASVWYVQSTNGIDAASPSGLNREKPLATLEQALTNASDGDIVVLLSAHTQTISTTITISKKLIIIGEGSSGGQPTVKLNQGADVVMLALATARVELRNIKFPEATLAVSARRVQISGSDCVLNGCYFELGAHSGGPGVYLMGGGDRLRIENTTLISTGTGLTSQPSMAVQVVGAVSDIVIDGLVLSDGVYGFSNVYAWDSSGFVITRLYGKNVSLLLGADMKFNASTTGFLNVATATGGGKAVW